MDDLEDSLKRLFQDPRLDMRVAPGAEQKVVAGARRVRRNRIALVTSAGVLSLAVLAGGTFLLARPAGPETTGVAGQPSDLPVESSEPTTTVETPQTTTTNRGATPSSSAATHRAETTSSQTTVLRPPQASLSIGPTGFGSLVLGMSEADLANTNSTRPMVVAESNASCVSYRLADVPATLTVSKRYGLVSIAVTEAAQTPERMSIGSPEAAVRSTYRAAASAPGTFSAIAPGNSAALYQFRFTDGKVSEIALVSRKQDCPG